ncbi:MAG: DNA internalization-related competence protein ComEC/Rec2 [Ignavibacteriales bacterium]|nr:DNA internalization-related competence protein ComEC/Rec2 [Ignavibacteriales bacterium]
MRNFPLIKFVILFCIGLIIRQLVFIKISLLILVGLILLIISLTLFKLKKIIDVKSYFNIVQIILIPIIGCLYLSVSMQNSPYYPFDETRIKNAKIYGEVYQIQLEKENQFVLNLNVDSIDVNLNRIYLQDKFLCKIRNTNKNTLSELYDKLRIGNYIELRGTIYQGREQRNPGEFNYQEYLESIGISALFVTEEIDSINILNADADIISNIILTARKEIDKILKDYHTEETAALLRGLILADRTDIDYEVKDQFVNAGVVHVLAVSGLHVGYIVLIFLFLFGRTNIVLRFILTMLGVVFFMFLTGAPPSVFRATVMTIVLLSSFLTVRSYNSYNALALAGLIILLLEPTAIFNPGFQLSFSAVLSIIWLYPKFSKLINESKINNSILKKILLFSAISFSAQIGTMPFTIIYFNKLSVVSLFANIIVIPLIGVILAVGIVTIITNIFSSFITITFASANNLFSDLLYYFVSIMGGGNFSYIPITNFSIYDSIIFYAGLIGLIYYLHKFKSVKPRIILLILIVSIFFVFTKFDDKQLLPDGKLSVIAIDVGQGDAILIKFPNNETALIDGGNANEYFDNGKFVIAPLLQYLEIDKINYGIVTHLDADHLNGYISLIEMNLVEKMYKPPFDSSSFVDILFEGLLKENNVEIKYHKKDTMTIGGCRVYCLNDTNYANSFLLDGNDNSGVHKIVYGKTSFLFTGDIGHKTERILTKLYKNFLESDVLKLGHHGSKGSSCPEFIRAVAPQNAIISAGVDNKFGHPAPEVIQLLEYNKIHINRTDLEGAILYISDGKNIEIINWKKLE